MCRNGEVHVLLYILATERVSALKYEARRLSMLTVLYDVSNVDLEA